MRDEVHCALCGRRVEPSPEQLESLRRGEITGVGHIGEFVERSGNKREFDGKQRMKIVRSQGVPPLTPSDEFTFPRVDGKYEIRVRWHNAKGFVDKKRRKRRMYHALLDENTSLCGHRIPWIKKSIKGETKVLVDANQFREEFFIEKGLESFCSHCIKRGSTIIEVMEAEKR